MSRFLAPFAVGFLALTSGVEAQVGTSQIQKFEASTPTASGRFGGAIARDADEAAIGVPGNSGAVELWEFGGTDWSFVQRITATGGTLG